MKIMTKETFSSWKTYVIIYSALWLVGIIMSGSVFGDMLKFISVFFFLLALIYIFKGTLAISDQQKLKKKGRESLIFAIALFILFVIYGISTSTNSIDAGMATAYAMGLSTLAVILSLIFVGVICLIRGRKKK
jgi:hypothetical protein